MIAVNKNFLTTLEKNGMAPLKISNNLIAVVKKTDLDTVIVQLKRKGKKVQFARGDKEKYNYLDEATQSVPEDKRLFQDMVYFSKDTNEIYMNGQVYGLSDDLIAIIEKAFVGVEIEQQGDKHIVNFYNNAHEKVGSFDVPTLSGGSAAETDKYVDGVTVNDHTITVTKGGLATEEKSGLMSAEDKKKLDGLDSNSIVDLQVNSTSDTVTFTVTKDNGNGTNTTETFTFPNASETQAGAMTAEDYKQLHETLPGEIEKEKERATTKEKELEDLIKKEEQRATTKESELQTQITTEKERAESKEKEIENNLTKETDRATAREKEIEDKLEEVAANPITLTTDGSGNAVENLTLSGKTLTQHKTKVYALKSEVDKVQQNLDQLVSGDVNTAIDNFNEIEEFLEGITDDKTLTGLLKEQEDKLTKDAQDKYVKKTGDTMSGTLTIEPTTSGYANLILKQSKNWRYIRFEQNDSSDCWDIASGASLGTDATLEFRSGKSTNMNTKVAFLQNGNVGIGTTAPDAKLHVKGNIYSSIDVTAFTGFRVTGMWGYSWNKGDGAYEITIQDNNNQTPLLLAHRAAGKETSNRLFAMELHNTERILRFGFDGSWKYEFLPSGNFTAVGNATAAKFIKTGGTATQFLKANGEVAEVYTKTEADNKYYSKTEADDKYVKKTGDTMTGTLNINPTGATSSLALTKTNGFRFIRFYGGSNNLWDIAHGGQSGTDSALSFLSGSDSETINRVTFLANGNVGIGTTAPDAKLHVYGNAHIKDALTVNNSGTFNGPLLVNPGVGNLWDDGIRIVSAQTGYAYVLYGATNATTGANTTGKQWVAGIDVADQSRFHIWHGSSWAPNNKGLYITDSDMTFKGSVTGNSFKVPNGTAAQFLKADGSVGLSYTTVTSLTNVPTNYDVVVANINTSQTLTFATPDKTFNHEIHILIYNTGSNTIIATLSGSYKLGGDSQLEIEAQRYGEANCMILGNDIYVRGIGS